jgi:hypothetical protein
MLRNNANVFVLKTENKKCKEKDITNKTFFRNRLDLQFQTCNLKIKILKRNF